MFNFSTVDTIQFENTLGISNLELGHFDLSALSGAEIEKIRLSLIQNLKKIVLVTTKIPYEDVEKYRILFKNALILNIKYIKICLCQFTPERIPLLHEVCELAECFDVKILLEPRAKYPLFTEAEYLKIPSKNKGIIVNPLEYVKLKKHPFLGAYYKSKMKKDVQFFRIADGTFGGEKTLPGQGNGELYELVSILLTQGFDGYFSVIPYSDKIGVEESLKAFQKILGEL